MGGEFITIFAVPRTGVFVPGGEVKGEGRVVLQVLPDVIAHTENHTRRVKSSYMLG